MECLEVSSLRRISWKRTVAVYLQAPNLLRRPTQLCLLRKISRENKQLSGHVVVIYPINMNTPQTESWRDVSASVSLEEGSSLSSQEQQSSQDAEQFLDDVSGNNVPRKLSSDELKSLLTDSERLKLLKKLSEANQYNRFLKRQLQLKDDYLINFKNELAVLELELQGLLGLAEEIANTSIKPSSRKINGKYIQSVLLSRLEAILEKVKVEIKDVEAAKVREVTLSWVGMAECVQVMGSFDGWSYGEELSPEYDGNDTRFSTALRLRPGRYEIKFLVDGEWQLSPEFPTVGEGLMENNLLVVE